MSEPTYKIVRHYFKGRKQTIRTGLTLEEAKKHCDDPETTSTTATSYEARKRTREKGPWFDGFVKE